MAIAEIKYLRMAYTCAGDSDDPAIMLIHGWPDDASTWIDVSGHLVDAGFRTIVPSLRGFGETRFVSPDASRTANSGILAMDMIALADHLGLDRFAVVGHDWGSNVAEALAIGWPNRVERIALLSSPPRVGGAVTPPFWHAQLLWYQWFMATPRGAEALRSDPVGFARLQWENWSPKGWFDEKTFTKVARSWENPDWVDITLHSYRARWGFAPKDPASLWLEDRIASSQTLEQPAIYVQGDADGVNTPEATRNVARKFSGPFEYVTLAGVGHFPTREDPAQLMPHLLRLLS